MIREAAGGVPADTARGGWSETAAARSSIAVWIVPVAAAIGLIVAVIAYLRRGSGVDGTAGALLVVVSTALLVAAGLALALWRSPPRWWRILLLIACLLDILGTAVAAYFLHEWVLLAMMACAAVGWVVDLLVPRSRTPARVAP